MGSDSTKALDAFAITVEFSASESDRVAVLTILRTYNRQFMPVPEWQLLTAIARDRSGTVVGGVLGETKVRADCLPQHPRLPMGCLYD